MTHDEIQDLLEAYVDETLDRATRAEVDRHLAGCGECRAILDGVPAVQLGGLAPEVFDERAMQRAVRATLLRLAASVVVLGLAAAMALVLLGWLVFQPLVVDRGGRASAALQATADLGVMYHPGSAVAGAEYSSGLTTRTIEVELVTPVGAEVVPAGTVHTRLGPFSFGVDSADVGTAAFLTDDVAAHLSQVGAGTVATAHLAFDPPLPLDQAHRLAQSPRDVRVVWAGFPVGGSAGPRRPGLAADGFVGYSTCDPRDDISGRLGGTSGSWGGSAFTAPPSIDQALDAVRAAVGHLEEHPELAAGWDAEATPEAVRSAATHLAGDPGVALLVVTGPTPEVAAFVADASPSAGAVADVDFFNWFESGQLLCGR